MSSRSNTPKRPNGDKRIYYRRNCATGNERH